MRNIIRFSMFLLATCIGKINYGQETTVQRLQTVRDITQNSDDKIVLLSPEEAKSYIDNYRKRFTKRKNLKHTKSIFLDRRYFTIIKSFFDEPGNQEKYDGIRILFASYNKYYDSAHTHQAHKKQITIILAPTINKVAHLGDLNQFIKDKKINMALNHGELCPKSCDATTGGDGPLITSSTPSLSPDPYIFLDPKEARAYINNYTKRYTKLVNKKHSKSLWMPKKNFLFLGDFFKDDRLNKFGGVRVFFACYNKIIPETRNVRKKQITLIFTAADVKKEPDFTALLNYYCAKYGCDKNKVRQQSENHGELCPKICPPIND